jgi:hypothetical protein
MPPTPLFAGDKAFIGMNSRDNPIAIPAGFVSRSENVRMDRGTLTVRKGLERLTQGGLIGQTVYGSGVYINATGQEIVVICLTDRLYTFNPDTNSVVGPINYPAGQTITDPSVVAVFQAMGKVYITRGISLRPLEFNYATATVTALPTVGHQFPNSVYGIYYGNRIIVQDSVDSVAVSHYLDATSFSQADIFRINDGGNDTLVSVCPWTLNEFVVFMRNSVFYVSVGSGNYDVGDSIAADAYVKSLASDVGCAAARSAVQAGGGILFLSDNGVYILSPSGAGQGAANTPEGMRLLTIGEPLSSPIDDVIQRINRSHVSKAVAIYWENRYYLAVPLNSEDGSVVATKNNHVLVYNFINRAWESIDSYPDGFDVQNFVVAKRGSRRRLFAIDDQNGVFLLEELDNDEFGSATGTPILPFRLPETLNENAFQGNKINGLVETRTYIFDSMEDKRFASLEYDVLMDAGAAIKASVVTINPDVVTLVDEYGASGDSLDATRRVPVRKTAYGIKVRFESENKRPVIRGLLVDAILPGRNTKSSD